MLAYVDRGEVTQTVNAQVELSDDSNISQENYQPCGPITYTLLPSNDSYLPYLRLIDDTSTLILSSTDPSHITTYPLKAII